MPLSSVNAKNVRLGDPEVGHLLAHLQQRAPHARRVLLRIAVLPDLFGEQVGQLLRALREPALHLRDVLLRQRDERLDVGPCVLGALLTSVLAPPQQGGAGRGDEGGGGPGEERSSTQDHRCGSYDRSRGSGFPHPSRERPSSAAALRRRRARRRRVTSRRAVTRKDGDRAEILLATSSPGRSGGTADAADSKSAGLTPREGSSPSFGTERVSSLPRVDRVTAASPRAPHLRRRDAMAGDAAVRARDVTTASRRLGPLHVPPRRRLRRRRGSAALDRASRRSRRAVADERLRALVLRRRRRRDRPRPASTQGTRSRTSTSHTKTRRRGRCRPSRGHSST